LTLGTRRTFCGLLATSALLAVVRPAHAEEVPVPASRQAELIARVAAYDRNLAARAQGTVRVLVVVNPADADSRGLGTAIEAALSRQGQIARMPVVVSQVPLPAGGALAARCAAEHVSIVYLSSGLDAAIPGLVASLDGVDVLSIGGLPRYVSQGVVLGFDLVSGNPTLLYHLTNARRQNVAMEPNVVRLMQVYR
jgi:hypothetical protein